MDCDQTSVNIGRRKVIKYVICKKSISRASNRYPGGRDQHRAYRRCGGGNDASLSAVVNVVEFIGRTYTGSVPIDAGRAAALNLKVAANGAANGTMTLASRAVGVGRATPIVSKVGGIVNLQPAR